MENKKIGVGVGVLLVKDGKVLLGKRHESAQKAESSLKGEGTWTMPGGKLEFGEDFEDAATRELLEETGIKAKRVKVVCVNNDKIDTAHFVTIGVLCEEWEGEPKVMEPDQITEWYWFAMEDLPYPIYFPSAKILMNLRKDRFYLSEKYA